MEIIEKKVDQYYIITPFERLDTNNSGEFEKILLSAINKGEMNIVIDFEKLDYISSSGLRVLLIGAKKLNETKHKIILCNVKDHIQEVFDIAGFTALFNFQDDKNILPSLD